MTGFSFTRPLVTAVLLSFSAVPASAATIASGGTDTTGAGGFSLLGGGTIIGANFPSYFQGATDPASEWVWSPGAVNLTFLFEFTLTAGQVGNAALTGKWGIDNVGTVSLNGNVISTLPSVTTANFTSLTDFSTSADAFFTSGLNTLSFVVANAGGPAAFRASVIVTDGADPDPSVVPLPAAGWLMLAGLGGLAALRRRKTN